MRCFPSEQRATKTGTVGLAWALRFTIALGQGGAQTKALHLMIPTPDRWLETPAVGQAMWRRTNRRFQVD
jgi:hypothetical protein